MTYSTDLLKAGQNVRQPDTGDKFEFLSDIHTDKGPATCEVVDTKVTVDGLMVQLQYSGDESEWLSWEDLRHDADVRGNLWLIKSLGDIKYHGGYYLHGNPPRWHKITPTSQPPHGAPVAAHPESAGKFEPTKHFTDQQWDKLKSSGLDEAEDLRAMSDAGDVTGILASHYPDTMAGRKRMHVANTLLAMHGSEESVSPGQEAGSHAAVKKNPEAQQPIVGKTGDLFADIEQKPDVAAPAKDVAEPVHKEQHKLPSLLSRIDFEASKLPAENTNAKLVNRRVDDIKKFAELGDLASLNAMTLGSNTYSKKLMILRDVAIAAIRESAPEHAAVDDGAHGAATSPHNNKPAPTEAQIEAGNYEKGHVSVHGIDVAIENPRGSTRSGKRPDGSTWSHVLSDHYGYIKKTVGADGDQVDVFVGPHVDADKVFVIDQINQGNGEFDEHKVMLGYRNMEEAVAAYSANFDDGWKVGPVTELSIDNFKNWLKNGGGSTPLAHVSPVNKDTGPHEGDRDADGLVFHDGRWHREDNGEPEDDGLSDDPSAENYRFKDTGYIAGSRKEAAALSIRHAGKTGQQMRATDIDWKEIEKNPREAAELIKKSNLFGKVDWESLKESGMSADAGFIIDRVYSSLGTEPSEATPQARRDYALGLESLRDRLERCKSSAEVIDVLGEIRQELNGTMLNEEQAARYKESMDTYERMMVVAKEAKSVLDAYGLTLRQASADLNNAEYEQRKRTDRKWKPDPEIQKRIDSAQVEHDAAYAVYMAYKDAHPELETKSRKHPDGWSSFENDLEFAATTHYRAAKDIVAMAKMQNLVNNPITRAWITLGPKFLAVLNWRGRGGSDAFRGHVTNARAGKIKDWDWAEKTGGIKVKKATKREKAFHLIVVDEFERKGGRQVKAESTASFKSKFGVRDVQSGNWVLDDPNSAAWHIQSATEAFSDLADIIGVDDNLVSINGRLAMAFGARGSGNAGWKGAARAHYEPVERVINLTKMGGGGALAHEWAHALDNMAVEAESGRAAGVDDFCSNNPDLLPEGELRDAFVGVRSAMLNGTARAAITLSYDLKDMRKADYNIKNAFTGVGVAIRDAGSVEAAVQAVDEAFAYRQQTPKVKKLTKDWRRLAVAYYDRKPDGGEVKVKAGPTMSEYAANAADLDAGGGEYWSTTHEMFARGFQAYCEDKLAESGRKSDYLSAKADNKWYRDPLFGDRKPFPEGEERTRINAAFDKLMTVVAKNNVLAKALL